MRIRRFFSATAAGYAAAVGILATEAGGQAGAQNLRGLDDVRSGAALRVTVIASPPERLSGRFVAVRGASLLMKVNGSADREIPLDRLLRVDESYRDRRWGAVAGAVPAVLAVYAWDFFGPHPRYADQKKRYRENVIALAASVSAGALIGASIGWKRWRLVLPGSR
jgi:hypothetical protein